MNQQKALRRLEALEAKARVAQLTQQRDDPGFRAQAAELALEFDMTVEHVIDELLEIARRIAEIGQDAWDAECLAEDRKHAQRMGMNLERYQEIDWRAEYAAWVAQGSIVGAWRGRDWNHALTRPIGPSW